MAQLKPGTQLRSSVCDTVVLVIQAPASEAEITCGGAALVGLDEDAHTGGAIAPDAAGGTLLGKRYVNKAGDLELLCTKPGKGSLACDGAALSIKGAKPLPASD